MLALLLLPRRRCAAVAPAPARWRRGLSSTAAALGLKVLFFGTDQFAERTLTAMMETRFSTSPIIDHIEVVCPPTVHKRRGKKDVVDWQSEAGVRARKLGLKVHHPPERGMALWQVPRPDPELCGSGGVFDIGVVSSFGRILPPSIVGAFPKGMINVHPSLLPKYRGPSPIQTAILNGDATTGVTVQELHPHRVDAGRILAQVPYKLGPHHTREYLMAELGYLGGLLAGKVLQNLDLVRKEAVEQDESQAVPTKMFTLQDTRIDWETMGAKDIYRMHRAHRGHGHVHSFLRIKNRYHMVKFVELEVAWPSRKPLADDFLDRPPGTIFNVRKVPYIEFPCIDGSRLHVYRFHVAGKQETDRFQFAAGYVKKSKDTRMVSIPCDPRRPTPPFVYPPDYRRPSLKDIDTWAGSKLHADEAQADEPQADEPQADEPQADEPQADEPQAGESATAQQSSPDPPQGAPASPAEQK
ncbi:Methionyl-tRNA formyltransferase [Coemansia javaensis]|uniref:methionyl-tRNA formyltransferase n=1 Tax=Coemansia javaensis TaxID=2761396 RepID=A0A9W8HBC9_9FUNG|nr:Methionyl-tRNA formyltransferase [Coemansia javaensis]